MRFAVLGLAVLPPLLLVSAGCVQSRPLLVRNEFAASYWCPVNQIEVRPEPGSEGRYHVTGCGLEVTYDCSAAGETGPCQARLRVEYEATDGTSHGAWLEEEVASNNSMARDAALASAAHDLPCDRASIQVVGADPNGFANIVEGCGQRVTYQIADVAGEPTASPSEPVKKHKYVVLTRTPLAAPPAPPASAPPAPPAPAHSANVTTPPPQPPASAGPVPAPAPPPAPSSSASPLTTPR
ncbi:MAG TPA: hypothetical protein VF765_11060 [Polyangiaceae bacterium]